MIENVFYIRLLSKRKSFAHRFNTFVAILLSSFSFRLTANNEVFFLYDLPGTLTLFAPPSSTLHVPIYYVRSHVSVVDGCLQTVCAFLKDRNDGGGGEAPRNSRDECV